MFSWVTNKRKAPCASCGAYRLWFNADYTRSANHWCRMLGFGLDNVIILKLVHVVAWVPRTQVPMAVQPLSWLQILLEVFWSPVLTFYFSFFGTRALRFFEHCLFFSRCLLKDSWLFFFLNKFSSPNTWSSLSIAAETCCQSRSDSNSLWWSTGTVYLFKRLALITGVGFHNTCSSCYSKSIQKNVNK